MAMAGEDIAAMIKEALPDAQVEMVDLAGDNNPVSYTHLTLPTIYSV